MKNKDTKHPVSPKFCSLNILTKTLSSEYQTTFNNYFANATSIPEAVFLSWFLYMWEHKQKNGEMFIVEAKFTKRTSISKSAFRKVVKKWEELNIIRTKCKGLPLKKWYELNTENLLKYMNLHFSKGLNPHLAESGEITIANVKDNPSKSGEICRLKARGYIIYKENIKEERSPVDKSTRRSHTNNNRRTMGLENTPLNSIQDKPAYKIAKKLSDMLAKHRWINWLPKLNKWIVPLQKLHDSDINPVKWSEMRDAIAWLDNNANALYCPKPRNAEQFASKFGQIWIQMHQATKDASGNIEMPEEKRPLWWWQWECKKAKRGVKCCDCGTDKKTIYHVGDPFSPNFRIDICAKCHHRRYNEDNERCQNDDSE